MKITAIEPQKKQNRFNIFLDGKFGFGISADLRFTEKLEVGKEISDSNVKQLIEKNQIEKLLNKSLKFLSFRPRSEKEIREYLLRKGRLKEVISQEEKDQYQISVEKVIKKLKVLGQIDDREFTKWWVEQRTKIRPKSPNLIKRELLVKGIDRVTIEGLVDYENEEALAFAAAKKKVKYFTRLDAKEFKIKLGSFLARQNFSWSTIKKVVDTLFEDRVE